VDIQRHLMPQR